MKFLEMFRFEIGYQSRRPWTWVSFVALLAITYLLTSQVYAENARTIGYFLNSPFVILSITFLASFMGLLVSAALAGDAGARDVQTRMNALVYTSSVSKGSYLRARFLAAFTMNAAIMLAAPLAMLLSTQLAQVGPELLAPVRVGAYASAFCLIALPNAFVSTALLFSVAALTRRAIAGYVLAAVIFLATVLIYAIVASQLGRWDIARIVDPMGMTSVGEISRSTTVAQKNTLSLFLVTSLLLNRVVWVTVALLTLAYTHLRFRFAHSVATSWRRAGKSVSRSAAETSREARAVPIVAPVVVRTFGFATRLRQVAGIAVQSFREVALSWGGLVLGLLTAALVLLGPTATSFLGIPMIPTTREMTSFAGNTGEILWMIVPLLTAFYVGELVWRDRDTGLSEIADATPVKESVRFAGRYLGFALVFVLYETLMTVGCMLIQAQLGYLHFEMGLYARIFFGLQLPEHLSFALLAFAAHVIVNQKYVGHLVVIAAYTLTAFAPSFGIAHNLLVYGSAPGWSYSDLRGFGGSVAPWMWFKLYWASWAMLMAVATKVFWVRGRQFGIVSRLRQARRRLTPATLRFSVAAIALMIGLGGFVFYNTNVLNAYETDADRVDRRAEYERAYARFAKAAQPLLTGTVLRVEIYPERHQADIRASYQLRNTSAVAIDSIHFVTERGVETGEATFDRPVTPVVNDTLLGYRIYALATPLAVGDSLRVNFTVRYNPRGFTNAGLDASVSALGASFDGNDWLPDIGYQRGRELAGVAERRAHRLPPRNEVPSIDDEEARRDMTRAQRISFDAVIGTMPGQTAAAPGTLRRTWAENGRRYFHYVANAPIRNDFSIFSAAFAVRRAEWRSATQGSAPVAIEVLHHPAHTANIDNLVRSVQASLSYYTSNFGPYPHSEVRLVESPGNVPSLHASPVNVMYTEGFASLNPARDPRNIDFRFAVVAHELGHYWWGNQVSPADVQGAPLLSESLAWYSALCVVEATYGKAHLARLLDMMREVYLTPRSRAGPPLLLAYDRYQAYRVGPFAMFALREYVGAKQVNAALRRMVALHGAGAPPLPTSRDLYEELKAVTPDSLRYLLSDLFERNTFWELSTKAVTVDKADTASWRVTLDVKARKVAVDTAAAETEMPMNDLVEIGVFGSATDGDGGEPLYLRLHRIHSGEQRITVTVPRIPARAGIDPRNLLIDVKPADNVRDVKVSAGQSSPR